MEQQLEQQTEPAELAAEQPAAQINKRPWLVWAIAGAAVLLVLVFVLVAVLGGKGTKQPQTEPSTTEDTALQATEPTFLANPYGPNDFQFAGDYLSCLAGESILGIDVSSFQGEIDWSQVRAAGVEFVIIRVGGRGYGAEGKLYEDAFAQANYAGAKAAGLQVGAYFFSQAVSQEEARQEAAYVLERIKDWELDMPVVYDWEHISDEARTVNVDARMLTDCTLAFCRDVEAAGHEAMVYFNPDQFENRIFMEELTDYRSWLAMYSYRMTYPYQIDMWQYTNEGNVPGIDGPVDINLYFSY